MGRKRLFKISPKVVAFLVWQDVGSCLIVVPLNYEHLAWVIVFLHILPHFRKENVKGISSCPIVTIIHLGVGSCFVVCHRAGVEPSYRGKS